MARLARDVDDDADLTRRITPLTRREIFDYIRTDGAPWWGRLDERSERIQAKETELEQRRLQLDQRNQVRDDLARLFTEPNPWKRGKQLEVVLNRLFGLDGISVRDSFHLTGDEGEGIVEQIDGAVAIDGEVYLVEMKWLTETVGAAEIAQHLVRPMSRSEARGIFISASDFGPPAVAQCKDILAHKVSVLCELEKIVHLLERPDANIRDT